MRWRSLICQDPESRGGGGDLGAAGGVGRGKEGGLVPPQDLPGAGTWPGVDPAG